MVPIFAGTTLLSPNAETARIAITSHRVRARIACLLSTPDSNNGLADYTSRRRAVPSNPSGQRRHLAGNFEYEIELQTCVARLFSGVAFLPLTKNPRL